MMFHPSTRTLIRFTDKDLAEKKFDRIASHLKCCAGCRTKQAFLDHVEVVNKPRRKLSRDFKEGLIANLKEVKRSRQPIVAEIKKILGVMMVFRNGDEEGVEGFPGMGLRKGYTVKLIGDSRALIELNDGSHVYLNRDTEVNLPSSLYNLSMLAGEMFAMMKPQKKKFEIKTPSAVLGVVGTDFDAQVTKKNKTILKVLKGKVAFKNDSGDVLVRRKRQIEASKYTKPTPTVIKDARAIAAWAKPMNPRLRKREGVIVKKVSGLVAIMAIVLAIGLLMHKSKSQELKSPEVTVTVSGKVIDAETSQPIPNATVRGHIVVWRYYGPDLFEKCPYQEMKTGVNGAYRLTFVTPLTDSGQFKEKDGICVYASAPGYETKPVYVKPNVTIHNTDFPNADIELAPGKLVKGKVVNENNEPIEDALVRVRNGLNGDWNFFGALGKTYTNENGEFEVWCMKEDREGHEVIGRNPWLHIVKQGYGAGHFWGILEKEDMGTLVIPRGGTVTGRVIDPNGNGIANCEISVRGWGGRDEYYHTRTNAEGKYVLDGVPGVPSLVEFYKRKNPEASKKYPNLLTRTSQVEVYARFDPERNLEGCPHYEIEAKEGETITAPDLIVR